MTLSTSEAIPLLFNLNRRSLLKAASLAALAGIAACSTVTVPTGEGAGVSSSATATLAGIRGAAGLPALVPDAQLEQAALQQAGYMASRERMSHTTSWGTDFASRMKDNGVRGAAAENIAEGRFDQQKLFDIWMHSAGHRRNMLMKGVSRYGIASATGGNGRTYWVLELGN